MTVVIGSAYAEKRAALREAIKKGTVSMEQSACRATCYFCLKPIEGKVLVLTEESPTGRTISHFFIDEKCCTSARLLHYDRSVFSIN